MDDANNSVSDDDGVTLVTITGITSTQDSDIISASQPTSHFYRWRRNNYSSVELKYLRDVIEEISPIGLSE